MSVAAFGATPDRVKQYTDYLYSTMILADSLDYPRSFYERNVELSLDMRDRMPWGRLVSERDFRNFVLPVRVNNEHLDDARQYLIQQLTPLVEGLTMSEAALEINHWLHSHVTYRPSDARTSPPLSTLRTSFGRCGEESTLGVAAMRAMGIPARQVYTPRWAHTDDNHAWVEVWTDGRWHFLGACEPEAVLDLGWFNAPASRGMLMSANADGRYDGPEEVLAHTSVSTSINVTSNYAPVDTAVVFVVDTAGQPVTNASVNFMLYNYAEYYPVARKTTDAAGRATLTAGLGDMVIWATDTAGRFGIDRYTVGSRQPLLLTLDKDRTWTGTLDFTLVPPRQSSNLTTVTPQQQRDNTRRLAVEDSLRNAYFSTFFNPATAAEFVCRHALPADAAPLLQAAYGNHDVITAFLTDAKDKQLAADFLKTLSDKDIRDISPDVLADFYIDSVPDGIDRDTYLRYVACPRVYDETLTPYKTFFIKHVPEKQRLAYRNDPQKWIDRITTEISVEPCPTSAKNIIISPEAVYTHRKNIPPLSRDIFAVASLRSFGVPAYLDRVTMTQHYIHNGQDIAIIFGTTATPRKNADTGRLQLTYDQQRTENPGYYTHFTLSRIVDGQPELLNFAEDATYNDTFATGTDIPAGQTLLVTGQRLADGTVLSRAAIFDVPRDSTITVPLQIRNDPTQLQVIGNFNSENRYRDTATQTIRSLLSATGRGYYVLVYVKPHHEPSTHVLNELMQNAPQLEKWPGRIMIIVDGDTADNLAVEFPNLPANVIVGTDIDRTIAAQLTRFGTNYPMVIIADTFNRVVYATDGYTIGTGHRLADTLTRLPD